MKSSLALSILALTFVSAVPVYADTVTLNFEGMTSNSNPIVAIGNYYNGGAGGNYGITFSSNAKALCLAPACSDNTSRGGQGDPNSQNGGLIFTDGNTAYIDSSTGFSSGINFFYTSPNYANSITVYSGLDGTGTALATIALAKTLANSCPGYSAGYCPFVSQALSFSGTGQSIAFTGNNQYLGIDDLTFNNLFPSVAPTPEPSSIVLLLTGLSGVATQVRRRFKK